MLILSIKLRYVFGDVRYKEHQVFLASLYMPVDSTDAIICQRVRNLIGDGENFDIFNRAFINERDWEKPILRELEITIPIIFDGHPFGVISDAMHDRHFPEELEIDIQIRESLERNLLGG